MKRDEFKKMHVIQQTQKIHPVRDEIIITAMKFVTYLTALFELRNVNFLPILSPYGTFHCKLLPSRNRDFVLSLNCAYFWFACNEWDFSELTYRCREKSCSVNESLYQQKVWLKQLHVMQLGIVTIHSKKLIVFATFNNFAFVEHTNQIGLTNGG